MVRITLHHNIESRQTPYRNGQRLTATVSHWLELGHGRGLRDLADWAVHAFNADLDLLASGRHAPGGETTFLAACVYRMLGYRPLSVGDVLEVHIGPDAYWLACYHDGWRRISEPSNRSGQPLSAATVYQHLGVQPTARPGH